MKNPILKETDKEDLLGRKPKKHEKNDGIDIYEEWKIKNNQGE